MISKIIRQYRKLGIYGRFLAAYLLFLALVSVFSIISVTINQNFIQKEMIGHRRQYLHSTVEAISTRISEAESIVYQTGTSPGINTFLNKQQLTGRDFYDYQQTWQNLPDYPLINDFIIDLYVYFRNSNVLMSSTKTSYRSEFFYGTMIRYNDLEYSQWMNQLILPSSNNRYIGVQKVDVDRISHQALTLLQSLPLQFPQNPKGTILMVLQADLLTHPMESVSGPEGGYYVTDNSGNILVSSFTDGTEILPDGLFPQTDLPDIHEIKIDKKQWFLLTETSALNGWQYTVLLPRSVVFQKTDSIKKLTFILAGMGLLVIIPVALFIARYNSLPLRRMLKNVTRYSAENTNGGGPMEVIESSITTLIKENDQMSKSLKDINPVMKNQTVIRLVTGKFESIDKINSALEIRGISLTGKYFLTVAGMLESGYGDITRQVSLNKLNMFSVLVRSTLENLLKNRVLSCNLNEDMVAILISFDHTRSFREELGRIFANLQSTLMSVHGLRIVFAAGSLRDSLMDLYISTTEAIDTLENAHTANGKPVFWYDENDEIPGGYYYPLSHEYRLVNFIRSGQKEQARTLFSLLAAENFEKRGLSRSDTRALLREILSTISKICSSLNTNEQGTGNSVPQITALRNRIRNFKDLSEGRKIFDTLVSAAEVINNAVASDKLSHNEDKIQAVKKYIQEHYSDINLSLASLAGHFRLTEAYLSNFFKEHTGMRYSIFIENIRIGKAKEMLRSGMPIGDIPESIGYASKNTFYKAFKRSEGISPGSYREQFI